MLFRPDHYYTCVPAVDLEALRAAGIRALLLDVDSTLLPRDSSALSPEIAAWIASLQPAGFEAILVSNNWHETIHARAAQLGLPVVAKAMKPLPFGFNAAARRLGVRIAECAVIGDQIFTDVLGGNAIGATTVLVKPLGGSDLLHTRVLRRIEWFIMHGTNPES